MESKKINGYLSALRQRERAAGTLECYARALYAFAGWLGDRALGKQSAADWKHALQGKGLRPATINAKLAAVNGFLDYIGRSDCRTRLLRLQRRPFRDPGRTLTRADYSRLLAAARRADPRLALLLESICATGVRVSEVQYLTVEAARAGRADIAMKGKVRTILLPGKLCRKLLAYARGRGIGAGVIFRGRGGAPLSRKRIWAEMKALCTAARVDPRRVFPHNLRHLFATVYYQANRDIARLADLLGHSSMETTRLYLATAGDEQVRQLERLGLVS